jgi:hypothetical protein
LRALNGGRRQIAQELTLLDGIWHLRRQKGRKRKRYKD